MELKRDILGREGFVNTVFDVMLRCSEGKKPISFAIDGSWGTGKSFVLDMLSEKLNNQQSEDTYGNRFMVFRYDSWEYDYYEEPIVAIVAAMQDSLVEQNMDYKLEVATNQAIKTAVAGLKTIANQLIVNKIGVDFDEVFNSLKLEDPLDDAYSGVRKAINSIRKSLNALCKHITIVIMIDELDRCLPEYVIKILNRCSHLFGDIPNLQVIYSINAVQLEHSVKSIFGDKIEMVSYLRKFYDYTFKLSKGEPGGELVSKYQEFFDLFHLTSEDSIMSDYLSFICAIKMDMRTIEKTMEKIQLSNRILQPNNADAALMLFEIISAFTDAAVSCRQKNLLFSLNANSGYITVQPEELKTHEITLLFDEWSEKGIEFSRAIDAFSEKRFYIMSENTFGRVLYALVSIFGGQNKTRVYKNASFDEYLSSCRSFWDIYSLMS